MLNIIYKITCLANQKIYIGQTWEPLNIRWKKHCVPSSGCIKLSNAIKKYGKDNFKIECLLITHTQELADYWEIYFIKQFDAVKTGYNLRLGGSRGQLTQEHKDKIGQANRGQKRTDEEKARMSAGMKGIKKSGKKSAISRTGRSRIFSDEQVDAIKNDPRSIYAIAKEYGVSKIPIRNIKRGKVIKGSMHN